MTPQAALTALAAFCDRIEAEGGHRTELLQGVRGLLAEVDVIAGADEYSRGYADGRRAGAPWDVTTYATVHPKQTERTS